MSASSSQIDSLRKLKDGKPKSGQKWVVYTTVYNQDLIGKIGKRDDEHGLIIFFEACGTYDEAKEVAIEKMRYSGYKHMEIAKCLQFNKLKFGTGSEKGTSEDIIFDEDTKRVSEYQEAIWKEEKEKKKKQEDLKASITEENENEKNPSHIEHYKRNVMLAIENRDAARRFERQAVEMRKKYEERLSASINHYSEHPEHDSKLLPFLKKKLEERGESNIYTSFENDYSEFRRRIIDGAKFKHFSSVVPGSGPISVISPKS